MEMIRRICAMEGNICWKRYLFLSCITCVSVLLAAGVFNYSMDPSHLFTTDRSYEENVSTILASGSNAANVSNYDDRLVQLYYIKKLKSAPDVILLGSSRGMQVRSYHLEDRSFFNHSVSDASIEDFMAIYQIYLDNGFAPSKVVFVLDPWILNRNNGLTRWQSIGEHFQAAVSGLNGTAKHESPAHVSLSNVNKWLNLISLGYCKASLKSCLSLVFHHQSQNQPFSTMDDDLEVDVIRKDGSRSYNRSFRNRIPEDVEKTAIQFALANPVYSLGNFEELDKKQIHFLEMLIDDMIKRGIHVYFLFMPYHPATYQRLVKRPKYRILADVQSQLSKIAESRGIRAVGSYNPSEIGLPGKCFFDGMHPKESATNKIWQVYDVPKIIR